MPVLQKAVSATFQTEDWREFGYEIGESELIEDHPRLLRSLSWGDSDYGGHVYAILDHTVATNTDNFGILLKKKKIKDWIKENDLEAYNALYEENIHVPNFKAQKVSPKEVVRKALEAAEKSIKAGDPENAVDRVHTALHGYLQGVCDKYSIAYLPDDGATRLFKLVRESSQVFSGNPIQSDEIKKILNSQAACVDAINTLRNHASMTHPNNNLLDDAEAILIVNSVRTLLHYLDAKIQ